MNRGFYGMSGAAVLGCGNDWTGPATTSPMTRAPRNPGFKPAPTMVGSQVQIRGQAPAAEAPKPLDEMQLGKAIGCTLCEAKKRLINEQRRAAGITEDGYAMNGSRRPNLGRKSYDEEGTLGCPACGLDGARIAAARLGQICAVKPVSSDGMNCQKTTTGDIICSNGIVYAADCPNSPTVNYPGVAENVGNNAKPPPAPSAAAPVGTVPAAATPADSGISPLAIGAGALVGIGLLFLIFK